MIKELGLRCGNWMEFDNNYVQITMLEIIGGDYIQVNSPYQSTTGPIFKDPETYTPEGHPFRSFNDLHPVPFNDKIIEWLGFKEGTREIKNGLYLKSIKQKDNTYLVDVMFGETCLQPGFKYIHEVQNILTDFEVDDTEWTVITK